MKCIFSTLLLLLSMSCNDSASTTAGTTTADNDVGKHFDDFAKNCDLSKPLYYCSEWYASSQAEWDQRVRSSFARLNPPLKNGESIFELGVGVGAVIQTLMKDYQNLWVGGSDLSSGAINIAKKVFADQADHFFVHDMTKKHEAIADNSYDHVVSVGALAQYLDRQQMLVAIAEATRMTKPNGSLLITNFMEASEPPSKYVHDRVEKNFWTGKLEKLGLENVKIHDMPTKGRYEITCTKKP